MTELAGYTARVYEMCAVFEDVRAGVYRRSAGEQDGGTPGGASRVVQHGMRIEGPLQIRGKPRPSGPPLAPALVFICLFFPLRSTLTVLTPQQGESEQKAIVCPGLYQMLAVK